MLAYRLWNGSVPFITSMEEQSAVIFHVNRLTYKAEVSQEQRREGMALLRQQGEPIEAVTSSLAYTTAATRENPELAKLVAEVPSFAAPAAKDSGQ